MPFSSGRSVRAPASKATSRVTARVPSSPTRWTGRPLWRVSVAISGIGANGTDHLARPFAGSAAIAANTDAHGCADSLPQDLLHAVWQEASGPSAQAGVAGPRPQADGVPAGHRVPRRGQGVRLRRSE